MTPSHKLSWEMISVPSLSIDQPCLLCIIQFSKNMLFHFDIYDEQVNMEVSSGRDAVVFWFPVGREPRCVGSAQSAQTSPFPSHQPLRQSAFVSLSSPLISSTFPWMTRWPKQISWFRNLELGATQKSTNHSYPIPCYLSFSRQAEIQGF